MDLITGIFIDDFFPCNIHERMWKEAVMVYFKELHQILPGGTEENNKQR